MQMAPVLTHTSTTGRGIAEQSEAPGPLTTPGEPIPRPILLHGFRRLPRPGGVTIAMAAVW